MLHTVDTRYAFIPGIYCIYRTVNHLNLGYTHDLLKGKYMLRVEGIRVKPVWNCMINVHHKVDSL